MKISVSLKNLLFIKMFPFELIGYFNASLGKGFGKKWGSKAY